MRVKKATPFTKRFVTVILALGALVFTTQALAQELPGKGVKVTPVISTIAEDNFQSFVIESGLKALGYEVQKSLTTQIQLGIISACSGDGDYYTSHWFPLQTSFWQEGGGDKNCQKVGTLIRHSLQGYLIDKKTADEYGIQTLDQLKDPKLAKLFDIDGDGKADLYGCESGWGCERVQNHHLDAYGLRDTVDLKQGGYFAIMPDAIERIRAGKPTLYYTWTPLWVSAVLRPGKEVVWLNVPFTTLPDERAKDEDTTVEGLGNLGFAVNDQHVLANTKFLSANPAAKTFFELLEIPIADVSAQNQKMAKGEDTVEDIRRHTKEWIAANQAKWDAWIAAAKTAK